VEFAGMRYGAVFGPWSGAGGGGPSNVIREAMRRALAGQEAVVAPSAMEWVYSKDAALGTVLALEAKDLGNRIFNVTMGSLTTPSEMADAIKAAVPGAKVKFETPSGAGLSLSNRNTRGDPARAKRFIGYEPQFKLTAAVADLADWMRKYPS
jgi:nucleoside-diphosphate-sugar epimerase